MPEILCFEKNPDETLATINEIRTNLNKSRTASVHRDKIKRRTPIPYKAFERIKEISPAASLVIAAEYSRFLRIYETEARFINIEKWNPNVLSALIEIGFFELFGFTHEVEKNIDENSTIILPMRTGRTADPSAVLSLIDDLRRLDPSADDASQSGFVHLYGAMIEAIVNVVGHAYPDKGSYLLPPIGHWWMTGAVNKSERWTSAMVFDQGVTIPMSLPQWQRYAGVTRRLFSVLGIVPAPDDPRSDGHAIAAAVEESVSSTGEAHRGQGLAQMRNFVDQCKDGYLRIMSRCGEVLYRPGASPLIRAHTTSIGGTLVEWNVRL